MGLLNKLGFGTKDVPTQVTPIQLHPNALNCFGSMVVAYLAGARIEVQNPTTGRWEPCPAPVFDPQYQYRQAAGTVPYIYMPAQQYKDACDQHREHGVAIGKLGVDTAYQRGHAAGLAQGQASQITVSSAPVSPSMPKAPVEKYTRGDRVQDASGNHYIVLGYKHLLCPNYDCSFDPDGASMIVMRNDKGMKPAVSVRFTDGSHKTAASRNIVRKVGTVDVGQIIASPSAFILADRGNKYASVRLCRNTFELKLS